MSSLSRTIPRQYDEDGFPVWDSRTSPVNMTNRAECLMHPDRVIPIVFVPGIMGSNLKAIDARKARNIQNVWRPDYMKAVTATIKLSAGDRKAVFTPSNVAVDHEIGVAGQQIVKCNLGFPDKLLTSRGWGTVYWKSYGPLLEYLETNMNEVMRYNSSEDKSEICPRWQGFVSGSETVASGGKPHALKLTEDELGHTAQYWFPVHAVGYNWLQSNEDSGKDLARAIDDVLAHYRKRWGQCAAKKVILVTHSMGGLVARAAVHPEMGNAGDKVLGILHGAMPALGAPAAYKRMKAGNESAGSGPVSYLESFAVMYFLGAYGQDVTAVMAQSPGGLQLLPNQNYPANWLTIGAGKNFSIAGDPYEAIYAEKSKWWRLCNPDWIDPGNASSVGYSASGNAVDASEVAWRQYLNCLGVAERFHRKLGDFYHPMTYAYYGDDPEHKSWGRIRWNIGSFRFVQRGPFSAFDTDAELKTLALDGKAQRDDGGGTIEVKAVGTSWMGDITDRFTIAPPDSSGDGTVPQESGCAPGKRGNAIEQFALFGFDHQSSYLPEMHDVMSVTCYSIVKLAQKADWGNT